ncbi:hypothetical protein Tco_1109504 [Tanacetum coccineum]
MSSMFLKKVPRKKEGDVGECQVPPFIDGDYGNRVGDLGNVSMGEDEVPLVDGIFEGALGALALEMEALVDAMVVYRG